MSMPVEPPPWPPVPGQTVWHRHTSKCPGGDSVAPETVAAVLEPHPVLGVQVHFRGWHSPVPLADCYPTHEAGWLACLAEADGVVHAVLRQAAGLGDDDPELTGAELALVRTTLWARHKGFSPGTIAEALERHRRLAAMTTRA